MDLWTLYDVEMRFYDKLCGSVPASPDLIDAWLRSRQPKVKPPDTKTIEEMKEEIFETLRTVEPEEEDKNLLLFQRVGGALVVGARTIKAHIKDCARVLSAQHVGKIEGERAFSTRVINGVYPDEMAYWIPILDAQGAPIIIASGVMEKPVRFRTRTGQQLSALKAFEWVARPTLRCTLKVLGKSISHEDLETLFRYGGVHGFGGERGDGEGKYIAMITPKIEKEKANARKQTAVANAG